MDKIDTILLVDDDQTSCFVINRLLEKVQLANHLVTVNSGLEALDTLKELSSSHKKLPEIIL